MANFNSWPWISKILTYKPKKLKPKSTNLKTNVPKSTNLYNQKQLNLNL